MCYNDVLEYADGDTKYGRKSYREFVEEWLLHDEGSPLEDIKGQVVLGNSRFIDWLYENVLKDANFDKTEQSRSSELMKEVRQEFIIDTVCRVFKVKKEELLTRRSLCRDARVVYIDLFCKHRLLHKSLKEIGNELGDLTVGGMSQIRKSLKEKKQKDNSLRIKYNQCDKVLEEE